MDRLVAFGRARLRFAHTHHELLAAANRDPQSRYGAAAMVQRTHVRMLLASAGTTGDLDSQTDALLALLEADYVEHQLTERDQSLRALGRCVGKPGRASFAEREAALDPARRPRPVSGVGRNWGRHPELVGLPVIVGGNGNPTEARKVVTCASYEAREFGVHAGMPLRAAARRCPEATFLPSDPRGV